MRTLCYGKESNIGKFCILHEIKKIDDFGESPQNISLINDFMKRRLKANKSLWNPLSACFN